ncbi:ATP-binding protein [Methylobacterium oryzae]|uniref:Signaling protein with an ATPase domain n=1 Tax=Methylobacterium oryzae CBMB20 TaxID=693986 RepID=A0A089NYU0_9HYPH|nr:ATP-binding protein [Methylobacterium oryzae]AIQ93136.1 Putative signaling protein with an ATPase domain [Methylobacterium oryzae CBMB20]
MTAHRFAFSADAALLRELGERLVGQPHIALAELVKNAYDADAGRVAVAFGPDEIVVSDDGDGMTAREFGGFWMRIGSPHKQSIERTRLDRAPTGSKGIGRLAVQFLGTRLSIRTTSRETPDVQLRAEIEWSSAARSGTLTDTAVEVREEARQGTYAGDCTHGTEIVVSGLNQDWDEDALAALAQRIWQLQTPFRREDDAGFKVDLTHARRSAVEAFETQMRRNLDIWSARLRGRLLPRRSGDPAGFRRARLLLEFAGEDPIRHDYTMENCDLDAVDFEIRVFSLHRKQRYGIGVEDARRYLREHGGVHIYDAGFHLPYYGPDADWLRMEIDHSHRLARSELLPAELQVDRGLNNLPTLSRVYGVVNVDTSREWVVARNERRLRSDRYLQIQASRDRLVDNATYRSLRDIVRYAVDFYAVQQTMRTAQSVLSGGHDRPPRKVGFDRIGEILDAARDEMPAGVHRALSRQIRRAAAASDAEAARAAAEAERLGSLALTGLAALARERWVDEHRGELETLAERLRSSASVDPTEAADLLERLLDASGSASGRSTVPESATSATRRTRRRLVSVLKEASARTVALHPEVRFDYAAVGEDLRLPAGTAEEWSGLFHVLMLDACEEVGGSDRPTVAIRSGTEHGRAYVSILPSGYRNPGRRTVTDGVATGEAGVPHAGVAAIAARRLCCELARETGSGPGGTTLTWNDTGVAVGDRDRRDAVAHRPTSRAGAMPASS